MAGNDILAQLAATGLMDKLAGASSLPKTPSAKRTATVKRHKQELKNRQTENGVLREVEVTSRRGHLKPETTDRRAIVFGRRAMSPWQARALGSGYGVVANSDMLFNMDPQRFHTGWGRSFDVTSGRNTVNQEAPPSPYVHINFPEWVR
jgi:hypothetical protein